MLPAFLFLSCCCTACLSACLAAPLSPSASHLHRFLLNNNNDDSISRLYQQHSISWWFDLRQRLPVERTLLARLHTHARTHVIYRPYSITRRCQGSLVALVCYHASSIVSLDICLVLTAYRESATTTAASSASSQKSRTSTRGAIIPPRKRIVLSDVEDDDDEDDDDEDDKHKTHDGATTYDAENDGDDDDDNSDADSEALNADDVYSVEAIVDKRFDKDVCTLS